MGGKKQGYTILRELKKRMWIGFASTMCVGAKLVVVRAIAAIGCIPYPFGYGRSAVGLPAR
jgi:hypothetical protein